MRLAHLLVPSLLALLLACNGNGDGEGPSNDGGSQGNGGSGGSGGPGGGGGAGGDGPRGCTYATQCGASGFCHPETRTCTGPELACTVHADCGGGAYCTAEGRCARNSTGGPCDEDVSCPPGEACTGGYCGCAGDQFVAQAVPPNVLIMLDRSSSMRDKIGGSTKWEIAVNAIENLLVQFGDQVRFGLMLYPMRTSCGVGEILVDVGPGTANDILAALDSNAPGGSTPIGNSLAQALNYTPFRDASRENFVLLVTDGEETCGGDSRAVAAQLFSRTPSVRTFVVGFGAEVDRDVLEQTAEAGGTALPTDPKYYQADDAASLETVFADIGEAVLSCDFELSSPPSTVGEIFVYFDDVPVQQDPTHTSGWDFDPASRQLTFYGASCEMLRSGEVDDLVIVQGCPVVIE